MHASTPAALRDPATPLADVRSRIGTLVAGRYRLLRMIGEGGMGAVFEAEALPGKERVAVKVIKPEFATSQEVNSRFIQEMQAAATVVHPNIVRTIEAGNDAHGPYMVLELLHGETLCDVLERRPLGPREALDVVAATLEALQAAHAAGIVHRDIKPENIFLVGGADRCQGVKLLDFGISKMLSLQSAMGGITRAGTAVGTPDYMSPEQASGGRIDGRADLWSVGAVLYESIAQRHAFEGDTYQSLISNIVLNPHVPLRRRVPSVPPELEAFIDRALQKEPSDRFPSAAAMLAAARALQARLPPDETLGFRHDEPTTVVHAEPNAPTQVIEVRASVPRPRPAESEGPLVPSPSSQAPTAVSGAPWSQPPQPVSPSSPAPPVSLPVSFAGRATPVVAALAASLVLVALAVRYRPRAESMLPAPVAPPVVEAPVAPPPVEQPLPSAPTLSSTQVRSPAQRPPVPSSAAPTARGPVLQRVAPPSLPVAPPPRPVPALRRGPPPPPAPLQPQAVAAATQTARQLVRPCLSRSPYEGPVVAQVTFDAEGHARDVVMQRPSRVTVPGDCMAQRLRSISFPSAAGQTRVLRFNLPE